MNKKIVLLSTLALSALMSTTALAKNKVDIGGFVKFELGFYDSDFVDENHHDARTQSKLELKWKNTAENGLEYGTRVRLLAATDETTQADKANIWIESKLGRIELGDDDGAGAAMALYAPSIGFGQAVDSDLDDFLNSASATQIGPKAFNSSRSTKITYFTPRAYGAQFGISYTPEFDNGENILRSKTSDMSSDEPGNGNAPSSVAGLPGNEVLIDYIQPFGFNPVAADGGQNQAVGRQKKFFKKSLRDFIELGFNYNTKVQDINLRASAAYTHAEVKNTDIQPNGFSAKRRHINAWQVGGQANWKNYFLGGGFVDNMHSGQLKHFKGQKRQSWNVGLGYATDIWGVSANYIGENYGKTKGNGSFYAAGVGGFYSLAPGIKVGLDYNHAVRKFGTNGGTFNDPGQTHNLPTGLKAGTHKDTNDVVIFGTRVDF